jgi:tetratricopeptide (TPR) repeat protein
MQRHLVNILTSSCPMCGYDMIIENGKFVCRNAAGHRRGFVSISMPMTTQTQPPVARTRIFVSYSIDDAGDIADAIYRHYTKPQYGYSVFVSSADGAIQGGENWLKILEARIAQCDIFLVIITRGALRSNNVYIEVQEARRLNKRIIPCTHSKVDRLHVKWGLGQLEGPTFTLSGDLLRDLDSYLPNIIKIGKLAAGAFHIEISGPSDLDNTCGIAYSYIKEGNYSSALEWANKATEIDPNFPYGWKARGVALGNLGRYNEAIESYDMVLRLDPNDASAWYNRGWTLKKLGKYNEAKEYFDRSRQLGYNP